MIQERGLCDAFVRLNGEHYDQPNANVAIGRSSGRRPIQKALASSYMVRMRALRTAGAPMRAIVLSGGSNRTSSGDRALGAVRREVYPHRARRSGRVSRDHELDEGAGEDHPVVLNGGLSRSVPDRYHPS